MRFAQRIDFESLMEPVAKQLLGEPNASHSKPGRELRFGTQGSLSVDIVKGRWYDHENKVGGGVLDLIKHVLKIEHSEAMCWLRESGYLPSYRTRQSSPRQTAPNCGARANADTAREQQRIPRFICTYDYTDEAGTLVFQVVRYVEPKTFKQRRPGAEHGDWIWNLDGVRRVLYRLPAVLAAIKAGETVIVVEGEKDADKLAELGFAATTNAGGAGKWGSSYSEALRGADVVIIPDNDEAGRKHADAVAAALRVTANRVRVLDLAEHWPECSDKGDVSDWIADGGGTADKLKALIDVLPDWEVLSRLRPLTVADFLSKNIKPREMILDPIIPEKGTAMLYAARGTGKTHIALGIAYAVAAGTKFLRWEAPKPRRVLLVDGEMPAAALQERIASIITGATHEPAPGFLKILAGDLIEEGGVGNLASPAVQGELDPHLDDVDLIILDNLSSLTAVVRDNDAESWNEVQAWLLRLLRRGISVLIVHHAGKGGDQRGTSRREDILDTSISLRRPSDYVPTEGARFEVHLEKARGVYGDAAKPFEAKLEVLGGEAIWTTRDIDDANLARVKALLDDGMTIREIADETGIPKSTVGRLKTRIDTGAKNAAS